VIRPYSGEDVLRLRGTVQEEHTLARLGAERLWTLLHERDYVPALGALTGGQAVQSVRAGLEAIYLSGWQVAADANSAGQTYPDQSLYPGRLGAEGGPQDQQRAAARRPDRAQRGPARPLLAGSDRRRRRGRLRRPAQRVRADERDDRGRSRGRALGGPARQREEVRPPRRQGPHPIKQHIRTLIAARLAADVAGVPTIVVARTDALAATLVTSDVDERDHRPLLTGERTAEGYHRVRAGLDAAITRGLAFAPYADLIWCETSTPDLGQAKEFAEAIHAQFPDKLLAYNCSPSFNWRGTSTTPTSPGSSASSARWDTRSSSSRWPASTR
jgi:isocitrate lyase